MDSARLEHVELTAWLGSSIVMWGNLVGDSVGWRIYVMSPGFSASVERSLRFGCVIARNWFRLCCCCWWAVDTWAAQTFVLFLNEEFEFWVWNVCVVTFVVGFRGFGMFGYGVSIIVLCGNSASWPVRLTWSVDVSKADFPEESVDEVFSMPRSSRLLFHD